MEHEQFNAMMEKLTELAKSKNNTLEVADIQLMAGDADLTPSELDEIYNQLDNRKIEVLRTISDDLSFDSLSALDIDEDFVPTEEDENEAIEIDVDNSDYPWCRC